MTFSDVAAAARGRWEEILTSLGISAEVLTGRHGPCPGCGGRDRFRLDDRDGRGTWICGGGGAPVSGDGFDLLVHVCGMNKREALRAVAQHLGIQGDSGSAARLADIRGQREREQIEHALRHEVLILLEYVQTRVIERELARDRRFRQARPGWRPFPPGPWEREELAARRIQAGLGVLYGG